ncbi:MAG: DUF1190 domain-containing protein [Hyphomicrobiales bacterium]|nr:DUF1190 domain-containing protein [Hyphomicrobiales bacterium]
MKRSRRIALITMGVSTLALAACEEPLTEAMIFRSVEECIASGDQTEAECKKAYAYAVSEHDLAAPSYASKEACEAEMGFDRCEPGLYNGEDERPYRPGFAAFMFARTGAVHPQPLYQSDKDPKKFMTADKRKLAARTGRVSVPEKVAQRPKNKVASARRGGFGASARRTSRSSGG